jgi:cardiolipin synthase
VASTRRTKRRLFGIDRSGPSPRETRRGAPLHPWTLPNLVGYLRLAAIPVFLVLAFESDDGRDTTAALIYLAIVLGDYVDGLLARATGQYSRMGALLDPVVDRLAVLSGAAVCWHFELLPRWALALLAVRELVTLVLAELALRRGIDLEINWIGRIAVFLVFASMFWAMVLDWWIFPAAFVVGVAIAVLATVLYVRAARGRLLTPDRNLTAEQGASTAARRG